MRVPSIAGALALIIPLTACYHDAELGNLGITVGLVDLLYEFESGDRVLVGTHLCLHLGFANYGVDEGTLVDPSNEHCFSQTLSGPAQPDTENCWILDTPGTVTWEWTPTNLDDCKPEFQGDRMVVEVTAPSDDFRLGFDDWRIRVPTTHHIFGDDAPPTLVGLAASSIEDLREDPSAARRVIAGQVDAPMLRLDDDLGRVYFADDVVFELVGEGATAIEPPPIGDEPAEIAGEQPLRLEPNAIARVRATFPNDLVLESPELIAVPVSDAASLDLMVVLYDTGTPFAAYAEVRDAESRVLHAAPIEWSVAEGAIGVTPGDLRIDVRTSEYAILATECDAAEAEPVERHAVLRARLGDLEDTVELTWIEQPADPNDLIGESCMFGDEPDDTDDPEVDDPGCACTTDAEPPTTAPAWLALAALLFVRRRRD